MNTPHTDSLLNVDYVIFGGTGDLAFRKLLPALFNKFKKGLFSSDFRIIASGRRDMTRDEYLLMVRKHFASTYGAEVFETNLWRMFNNTISYISLELGDGPSNWDKLQQILEERPKTPKIFYLSTPPEAFIPLTKKLAAQNLLTDNSRLILEKPVGTSSETSAEINDEVGKYVPEDRIFRVDHYLGKEAVQNLLTLRFSNMALNGLWNNNFIESVQISADESVGLEGRAGYYDHIGAARDMVQNHLLQLLALTAMNMPKSMDPTDIRNAKSDVLKALKPFDDKAVTADTIRGQYAAGEINGRSVPSYRDEAGYDSTTETFVQVKAFVDLPQWKGVPFYLRTGKRLAKKSTSISIKFKRLNSLFPDAQNNSLILNLDPYEGARLFLNTRGAKELETEANPFILHNPAKGVLAQVTPPDAYERILLDIAHGNPTLFIRRDEVKCSWDWIEPILQGWEKGLSPLLFYPSGSFGPIRN